MPPSRRDIVSGMQFMTRTGWVVLWSVLSVSCNERSGAPAPPATGGATPPETASASSASPPARQSDAWLVVTKGGYELGVVELLVGKPWRLVRHSASDDARALEQLITEHGAKPLSLSMHLPAKKEGERGPYGSAEVPPGDSSYRFAVEEHLSRKGFDVRQSVPRYADKNPPASVRKLEISRDGAPVGTLDFTGQQPKLTLVNREGNALFLESFWKSLERDEELFVSYLPPEGGKDALVTASAKKGSADYPKVVRLAFAVRYPAYAVVVVP